MLEFHLNEKLEPASRNKQFIFKVKTIYENVAGETLKPDSETMAVVIAKV
jgi:hypothetical protein